MAKLQAGEVSQLVAIDPRLNYSVKMESNRCVEEALSMVDDIPRRLGCVTSDGASVSAAHQLVVRLDPTYNSDEKSFLFELAYTLAPTTMPPPPPPGVSTNRGRAIG